MKKYLPFLMLLGLLGSILIFQKIYSSKLPLAINSEKIPALKKVEHSSHLFDPDFFKQADEKGQQYKQVATEHVFGGIIPHHLLAAPLISGFFEGIANQKVTTVILLSPNHYGIGPSNIISSKGSWTTIFGELQTDTVKVSQLENDKTAVVSEDIFETEHGIYGLTPFIKKTFPNAKMVPIAIKGGASKQECDKLVQSLVRLINDDQTIILVSSDFSHYLPSDQADIHDQESIPAIEAFDTDKIFMIDHEKNIDSPESVYTLLKVMESKNATKTTLLQNTNSAKLTGHPEVQSTTSYLTMYFTNKENSLSMDSIFNYVSPEQTSLKNNNPAEYTIIATGDVSPARSVNIKSVQLNDFNFPFEKTANFLKSADTVFINLETPLIPKCQPKDKDLIFCGDERAVQGLVFAGVNVANIANNHAGNYGISGLSGTIKVLNENNIQVTGNGKPAKVSIRDKKFGFLGYNSIGQKEPGIAWAEIPQLQRDIQDLKKEVDFVIVTFHWGAEYTSTPNTNQINLAHAAIDAGADLIIGNHPHWVQGIEQYKGKFIAYSHGNYIFDQLWSQQTKEGVLGKYTFNQKRLINVQFIPIIIDNSLQTRFADQTEATKVLTRIKESSPR